MATISDSYYYDGRKKVWKEQNILNMPIQRPNEKLLKHWLDKWDSDTNGYPEQESALNKLFIDLLPKNAELDDILIKVCTLNDFYSTNIYKVFDVAKEIQDMKLDTYFNENKGHPELVNELNKKVYEKTGRHIYSFASKYFSHHKPDLYSIYDSYVDKMLRYYRYKDCFCEFDNKDLLEYS